MRNMESQPRYPVFPTFRHRLRSGQAMVMVLLVTVVLISVTGLAVAMVVTNALSTTRIEQGAHALEIAESGAEDALLRLLRDPTLTTSTPISLTVDDGHATVDIAGTTTKTIVSSGTVDGYTRQIQVTATYAAGKLTVSNWREQ